MENRFFPLPLQFEVAQLVHDLDICTQMHWAEHFNTRDYEGDWTGISLRSANGEASNIYAHTGIDGAYRNTVLMEQCAYFAAIVAGFKCEIEGVRLLALEPGSVIKEHRDKNLGYEFNAFRLHIPILTDEAVIFRVDGCDLAMAPGSCWYANFNLPHSVIHNGTQRRIHLIIDGVRNEWTDELFRKAGYDFELEKQILDYDAPTKQQMIEHLAAMNTETARRLIEQLQNS